MKIAILYICTGKYDVFWNEFYKTAEQYLCPNVEKQYFVFTDSNNIKTKNNIHKIYQASMGWPNDTLMRFHLFYSIKDELTNFDAIYFFNANYAFITPIQFDEIKPLAEHNNLVGQNHPVAYHFKRKKFKYEINPNSTAYIAPNEGTYYLAGGLIGGATKEFLEMCFILKNNIDKDTENNVLAVCHDESHINRYFVDFPPRILHPGFCYPQDWYLPFPKKTLLRDKSLLGGHNFLRGETNQNKTVNIKNKMHAKLFKLKLYLRAFNYKLFGFSYI